MWHEICRYFAPTTCRSELNLLNFLWHLTGTKRCWVCAFLHVNCWVRSNGKNSFVVTHRKKNKQTNKMVVIGSRARANVWDGTGKSFLLYNCCHHVLGARLVGLDFPCNKKSVYVPVSHSTKSNQYLPKYQLNDFFPLIPTLLDTAPL